jgi:ADP-glucose pyrophosphorylase
VNSFNRSSFDIVIVSTTDSQKEEYWQNRLNKIQNAISPRSKFIVVQEDWPGGAGNGLGTLYAYQQAQKKGKVLYGVDIFEMQKEGASISLYHTAGKGMRLYPLTPSESNNKSAIKLPGLIGNPSHLLTILEATILQTAVYAASRPGRLSVFWGDQLFVPTKNIQYMPTHSIDILVKLGSLPTEERWVNEHLDKYGLLAVDSLGNAQQLEKTSFETFKNLVKNNSISIEGGVGVSLGSFSLSKEMTFSLLEEFENELNAKKGLFNTDFHFWMPMTLDEKAYLKLMKKASSSLDVASHYHRMQLFREKFTDRYSCDKLLGIVDIGKNAFWWDLGTVNHYFTNMLKLTSQSLEGKMMRLLFSVGQSKESHEDTRVIHDGNSILINCNIRSGQIKNSILLGVNAESLEVSNSLIINSNLNTLKADYSLLYNVQETEKLNLKRGTIRADIKIQDEYLKLYTQLNRDSLTDWNVQLRDNSLSYAELHKKMIDCFTLREL